MSEDEYKRSMAIKMLDKCEKYLLQYNSVLAIAVILDPCYKLDIVRFCYTKIYGMECSTLVKHVRDKLSYLFMEYSGSTTSSSNTAFAQYMITMQVSSLIE